MKCLLCVQWIPEVPTFFTWLWLVGGVPDPHAAEHGASTEPACPTPDLRQLGLSARNESQPLLWEPQPLTESLLNKYDREGEDGPRQRARSADGALYVGHILPCLPIQRVDNRILSYMKCHRPPSEAYVARHSCAPDTTPP